MSDTVSVLDRDLMLTRFLVHSSHPAAWLSVLKRTKPSRNLFLLLASLINTLAPRPDPTPMQEEILPGETAVSYHDQFWSEWAQVQMLCC